MNNEFLQQFQDPNDIHARQRREIEQPVVCETCGSQWFTEATFHQYSNIAYGSGTGGDLRTISNTSQVIRVCVCGRPVTPNLSGVRGRVATEDIQSFQRSLTLAGNFHKAQSALLKSSAETKPAEKPAISMDVLSKSFASLEELEALQGDLNLVREQLKAVEASAQAAAAAVALAEVASLAEVDAVEPAAEVATPEVVPAAVPATAPVAAPVNQAKHNHAGNRPNRS